MTRLEEVWPLFGLRITSPRLELNPIRDDQLPGLVDAVLAGIHDPAVMPFAVPWTDASPEVLVRETLKHQWRARCAVEPENWTVNFAVSVDDRVIGMQDVSARDFGVLRTVHTGSWLTREMHGRGYGLEMRRSVLQFAFDYLGARAATSEAADFNAASLRVSRSLGYRDNGVSTAVARPGEVSRQQHLRLVAADFVRGDWSIGVHGFQDARSALLRTDGGA